MGEWIKPFVFIAYKLFPNRTEWYVCHWPGGYLDKEIAIQVRRHRKRNAAIESGTAYAKRNDLPFYNTFTDGREMEVIGGF